MTNGVTGSNHVQLPDDWTNANSLARQPMARAAALMAVAALAHADEQYEIVQRISVALLRDASDQTANSIAVALASLPPVRVTLALDLLAGHPGPWMRR